MRRILLIVAMLLIATPAFATVTINAVYKGQIDSNYVVEVNYTADVAVRAFALNIEVNNGADINKIYGYQVGDNNGFGIFPGNFRDFITAATPDWQVTGYTPVAPAADRDAKPGIGTAAITVEMGSLYAATAPGTSGVLFNLNIARNSAPVFSDVNLSTNATRGGVVLETGASVTPTLNGTRVQFIYPPPTPAPIRYANYDPDCNVPVWWASVASATQYQCERRTKANPSWTVVKLGVPADFNCGATDCNWGDMKLTPDPCYRWQVKAINGAGSSAYATLDYDCNVIFSTCYPATGTTQGSYAAWRNEGRPDCWCAFKGAGLGPRGSGYQCDGDASQDVEQSIYRVYNNDAIMISNNWKKTTAMETADPNTRGTFHVVAACANVDHTVEQSIYRVYNNDAIVISNNWKKQNSSWTGTDRLLGNCPR
jgi:hypothetical protein